MNGLESTSAAQSALMGPTDRLADGFRIVPVVLFDLTYGVTN